MEFFYTAHAEENMLQRGLSKLEVEKTLLNPDKINEVGIERFIAQRAVGNKLLRVVYEETKGVYIIITAYYTDQERYR